MSDYMAQKADEQIEAGLALLNEAYEVYQKVKRRRAYPEVGDWVLLSHWKDADPMDAWAIGELTKLVDYGDDFSYGLDSSERYYGYARKFKNREEAELVKKYMLYAIHGQRAEKILDIEESRELSFDERDYPYYAEDIFLFRKESNSIRATDDINLSWPEMINLCRFRGPYCGMTGGKCSWGTCPYVKGKNK